MSGPASLEKDPALIQGKCACFRVTIVELSSHLPGVKERFIGMEEKITKEPAQSQRRGLLRRAFWTVAGVVGAGWCYFWKARVEWPSR
jgi:hypothetical protein